MRRFDEHRTGLPATRHPRIDAEPVPANPHGPEAVLAMQRQAGNLAVRDMPTVQRAPGPAALRRGSHGERVKQAQRKLSRVQASANPMVEDGHFGALTEAAVRTFQTTSGIAPANGVLDAATSTRLDTAFAALPPPVRTVLTLGSDSADVGFAQQKLNAVGATPRLVVNGIFGNDMLTPVMAFEVLVMHRFPTGIVDAAMWTQLDAAVAGGFVALEGASATPIEQHTPSGTADPRGQQVAGTSLHPVVGTGGLLSGPAVKELQQKLNTAGAAPKLVVDGGFGPLTTAAVRTFQTSRVPPLPGTGIADAGTWAALDLAAPGSTVGFIERQWTENTGGVTFGKTGANASRYSWEITPTRMLVTVKVNFTGLAPPGAWFGHVPALWNKFKAVRPAPAKSLPIDFQMIRGTGGDAMTVNVLPGNNRANAGTWFVADPNAASTIPHEYGHLIGLQDEYQQRPGDYVRITGHEPPVGATTGPAGLTPAQIATNLQNAMVARSDVNAFAAAPGAGMTSGAFAQRVLTAYAALPTVTVPAVPAAPGPPPVAALPAVPLTGDLVVDLDAALPNTTPRYDTIQVFTYTSGSIMGDPGRVTDTQDHGAAPRHVEEFVGIIGRALGGTWKAEQR